MQRVKGKRCVCSLSSPHMEEFPIVFPAEFYKFPAGVLQHCLVSIICGLTCISSVSNQLILLQNPGNRDSKLFRNVWYLLTSLPSSLQSVISESGKTFYAKKHKMWHHMRFMVPNSGRNNILYWLERKETEGGQFVVLLSDLVNRYISEKKNVLKITRIIIAEGRHFI